MNNAQNLPVLLLDNSSMLSVINEGEFKCYNISFEEAGHIISIHDPSDILKCFVDSVRNSSISPTTVASSTVSSELTLASDSSCAKVDIGKIWINNKTTKITDSILLLSFFTNIPLFKSSYYTDLISKCIGNTSWLYIEQNWVFNVTVDCIELDLLNEII